MGIMDIIKGKGGGYPKAFTKWVSSNYGPPGRISKSDMEGLFDEWNKKQGNSLSSSGGANALAN